MEKLYAKDYRRIAAEKTAPQKGKLALVTLIEMALAEADIVVGGPVQLGHADINKALWKGEDFTVGTLFKKFSRFGVAFVTYLLMNIFIMLWCLLLYIPGIIKSLSYSMTVYLMNDDETLSGKAAITKSRELMNGHKWELFCLELSYIGWILLSALTFGILLLWVSPKIEMAKYAFYLHITEQDKE